MANSVDMFEALSKGLSHVINEIQVSQVKDEWKMYMAEKTGSQEHS